MDQDPQSFEVFAANRLVQDRERITREWVRTLSSQLAADPVRILPHQQILDDIPVVLARAAESLLLPDPEWIAGETIVGREMRSIAHLRTAQGWGLAEVVREFDLLAQTLDAAASRWIDDYPGTPAIDGVGRVFGRLNRVPVRMVLVLVGELERERNQLLRQIATAEEEERSRLSEELHDQLGQLLAALLLGLKALERGTSAGDQRERIEELERLADRIARETQQLALDLRPPALEHLGLRQALENLVGEWSARSGIETDFQSVGVDEDRATPEIETALFRIAQEALANVLKHAGASRIGIVLECHQGGLYHLIVEDDGRGFDVQKTLASPDRSQRLGVRGMRERVSRLGGSLEIESSPGSGTTLFARIPFLSRPRLAPLAASG